MTKWTKEPPTEPGWYWFRVMKHFDATPFCLCKLQGGMRAMLGRDCFVHITSWEGEWWPEPIQEPQ